MFQHSRSIIRYPRECRDPHSRLLPTADICEQRLGTFLRLLLTSGVCEQRLCAFLRLLLTAGVCEQRLGASLRFLPTTDVCEQHFGMSLRLLLPAGVWEQHICMCSRPRHAHCRCLRSAFWCVSKAFAQSRCIRFGAYRSFAL